MAKLSGSTKVCGSLSTVPDRQRSLTWKLVRNAHFQPRAAAESEVEGGPALCVFTSLGGDSDAGCSLRTVD